MGGLLVSWLALFLVADSVTDVVGWNSDPGRITPAATGLLVIAGVLLFRQLVMNRSRARDENHEIAMSRTEHAIEEFRRERQTRSD